MGIRKKSIVTLIVILYLGTWVGGWIQHSNDLEANSWAHYRAAEQRNAERIEYAKARGSEPHLMRLEPYLMRLHEGGPITRVNWCIPILPGVLLANSDSSPGPLGGYGGEKIVLYYIIGSTEIFFGLVGYRDFGASP